MPHRLDVEGDVQWQEVGEGINGQPIRDERGPLRLHEEQLRGGWLREQSGQRSKGRRLATPTVAVEQTRAGQLESTKQGTEWSGMLAFRFEGRIAVRAGCAPVEKRVHSVL